MSQFTSQIPTTTRLEADCSAAIQQLRAALTELFHAAQADYTQPQQVCRKFGLDKSLVYRVAKLIATDHPIAAVSHLPGRGGMDILLNKMAAKGAPDDALAHVRKALDEFDRVVETHAGSRDRFELILDSMGYSAGDDHLLSSRQLAFRGNSGVCGVQARVRVSASFVVPGIAGPDTLDAVSLAGFVDFCRLRPDVAWPLFRFSTYRGDWVRASDVKAGELLDDGAPRLLREFCSPNMPEIESRTTESSTEIVLTGGEVGNLGAFDCYFGYIARGANAYRTPEDPTGEFVANISLPIERLIFDLHCHKAVPMTETPQVLVYNRAGGLTEDPAQCRTDQLLPIRARLVQVAGSPPAVATPHVRKYPDMVAAIYEYLNVDPRDMRCLRLEMPLPPMPSSIVARWTLPEQP